MAVLIDYTNYRGEWAIRHIELDMDPLRFFGSKYHPDQSHIHALDLDKVATGVEEDDAWRDFAMSGIHAWRDVKDDRDVKAVRAQMKMERAWRNERVVRAAAVYVCAGSPGTDQEKEAFAKLVGELTLAGLVTNERTPRLGDAPLRTL